MSYFSETAYSKNEIKVELYLPNYGTKCDLKILTGVDISKFLKEVDSANLKSKIVKLDIEKLKTTPTDLSELNNALENNVIKKAVYDKLVEKVNAIQTTDTSNLV